MLMKMDVSGYKCIFQLLHWTFFFQSIRPTMPFYFLILAWTKANWSELSDFHNFSELQDGTLKLVLMKNYMSACTSRTAFEPYIVGMPWFSIFWLIILLLFIAQSTPGKGILKIFFI